MSNELEHYGVCRFNAAFHKTYFSLVILENQCSILVQTTFPSAFNSFKSLQKKLNYLNSGKRDETTEMIIKSLQGNCSCVFKFYADCLASAIYLRYLYYRMPVLENKKAFADVKSIVKTKVKEVYTLMSELRNDAIHVWRDHANIIRKNVDAQKIDARKFEIFLRIDVDNKDVHDKFLKQIYSKLENNSMIDDEDRILEICSDFSAMSGLSGGE